MVRRIDDVVCFGGRGWEEQKSKREHFAGLD
jgi:hypothetical protein